MITLLLCLLSSNAHAYTPVQWKTVEKFSYTWDTSEKAKENKRKPAEFSLLLPKDWNDPGDFLRLIVQSWDGLDFAFDQFLGEKLPAPLLKYAIDKKSYVAAVPLAGKANPSILIVADYIYPSSTQVLSFMRLNIHGAFSPLPNAQRIAMYVQSLEDVDGDGTLEIIGTRGMSDPSEYATSRVRAYIPYLVYKNVGSELVLDEALSKKYNIDKRDGWAGPQWNKDIIVVMPGADSALIESNRGKVMTVKEAQKLVGKVYANEN
jgi:hypothetical protein